MLRYMIIFFLLAVLAAFFGFGGLAADFAGIARILAGLFVILFLGTLLYSLITGRRAKLPPL